MPRAPYDIQLSAEGAALHTQGTVAAFTLVSQYLYHILLLLGPHATSQLWCMQN